LAADPPKEGTITNVPQVDLKALDRLRRLGGDELVVKMIDLFVSHAEPKVELAVAGFDAGDLNVVERSVHSIRSSAANVGAEELREVAAKIERLAAEKKDAQLRPLLTDLENAFHRAKAVLQQERTGRTHEKGGSG
jgi:HPt (histidine-containing phosphotransfer) domain-containing protein